MTADDIWRNPGTVSIHRGGMGGSSTESVMAFLTYNRLCEPYDLERVMHFEV